MFPCYMVNREFIFSVELNEIVQFFWKSQPRIGIFSS